MDGDRQAVCRNWSMPSLACAAVMGLLGTAGILTAPMAAAHGQAHATTAEGFTLDAGVAATFRSNIEEATSLWQIPGRLMGGEAEPPESGFALDDANIGAGFKHASGVIAGGELATHHGGEAEIEQAYAGYRAGWGIAEDRNWQIAAGRLKPAFSPELSRHASQREFSENRLLDDAFYGGHYQDDGLQSLLVAGSWTAGIELWSGDSYPATSGSGGGAQDLFTYWSGELGGGQWRLGGWAFQARADDRQDDRLETGHSHGGTLVANDDPVRFDGRERHLGLHADTTFPVVGSGMAWHLAAEFILASVTGDLRDTTRTATLDGDYQGYWVQPAVSWDGGRHHLALRYERLRLDNHLSGPGAAILAESSGLQNAGDDPERLGLSYRFHPIRYSAESGDWHRLGVRLEWTHRDDGITEDYVGIGMVFAAEERFTIR